VTTVICLFIVQEKEKENQKKRNIKLRKIDKKNISVQVYYDIKIVDRK